MKKVYHVLFRLTALIACLWATSLSAEAHVKKYPILFNSGDPPASSA